MIEIIMITAVVLLSLLGLCEILHVICEFVLKPEKKAEKVLVLFPKKECIEEQIMLALHEISWHGESYADKVVVITGELDFDEKKACVERFSGEQILFADNIEELKEIYQRF